jgi:hypothetical protein
LQAQCCALKLVAGAILASPVARRKDFSKKPRNCC